jgi:hypothetical protein
MYFYAQDELMKLKQLAVVGLIASALALSGCGAMSTAVKI